MSGPSNTYAQAEVNAQEWLEQMKGNSLIDIELLLPGTESGPGRWTFMFRHRVTNVSVPLEIHGITGKAFTAMQWPPRTYWNGSSVADPELNHFAAPGYVARSTFVRDYSDESAVSL